MTCIESIKKTVSCSYEIIVIDNNSGTKEQYELKQVEGITAILNKTNRGFAFANNQGFKIAKGNFMFMLNPDTVLLDDAVHKMISFLKQNKKIHAVGPKLYHSEAMDYHPSVKVFPSPFRQFLWMLPFSNVLRTVWSHFKFDPEKTQKVNCVWGAAIMYKREVFHRIGFLDDENFYIYTEEVDFCKRMALDGLTIYYYPNAEVIHYGGKSQEKSSVEKNVLIWNSLINYFEKYFSKRNVRFNIRLLSFLLRLKVVFLKRKDLQPVVELLSKKLLLTETVHNE
jgi:hypothetical protein